jgi:O-antigen ligase
MACIALWRGDNVMGRLIIDNSRFADPNDLALVCLISIALCGFAITRKQMAVKKVAGLVTIAILLYAMARTGSRGAFLGFGTALVYVFWTSSIMGKLKMAIATIAAAFIAAMVLPPEVYFRYLTLFSEDTPASDMREIRSAEGSSEARLHLLMQSLKMTVRHPLLGVGPGNFAVAENEVAQAQGRRRGSWHQTHNMYTQVSSENGIPAALLYIAILVLALQATKRTMRIAPQHRDADTVYKSAFWIRVALLTFAVSGFFLSVAYCDMLPLLAGLAIALELAVRAEIPKVNRVPAMMPVAAGARA